MATWNASNTLVCIGAEDDYGELQDTPTEKFADMMEVSLGTEVVDIPQKTQTTIPQVNEAQKGREMPTVTLSGAFTFDHMILFTAATGCAASPYTWQTLDVASDSGEHSYTIIQARPAASNLGKGIVAIGCRLESLEITKNGQYIGYTANFRAKSVDYEVDLSGYPLTGITNTTFPDAQPFMWHNTECSLLDEKEVNSLNTFTLTLNNEFMDDDIAFQNAQNRARDYICRRSGQLTAEWLYGTTDDDQVYGNEVSQTLQKENIMIGDGVHIVTIQTEGQYREYTRPDKENCLYLGSFTKELMGDSDSTPLTIVEL